MIKSELLIKQAWQIIGDTTPIPADCGNLCGSACCKDGGIDTESSGNSYCNGTGSGSGSGSTAESDAGGGGDVNSYGGSSGSSSNTGENAYALEEPDELGMLLFPGEAELLRGEPGYRIKRIRYMSGHTWFLVCSGTCDRARRPLACRIFPLAPDVGEDGSVRALPDPRAARMCPLAGGEFIDRKFRGAVARALRTLARDKLCFEFMRMLSSELAELRRLTD